MATFVLFERGGLTAFGNDHTIVRKHIIDLMVLAASAHRSVGESSLSAVAAVHLARIFDHIVSHFSDPELSLFKIAQSMRISPRYVQRLLQTSGTSYHGTRHRAAAETCVQAPYGAGLSDVRICDIALQAGFSDISHFNRLFRSRFGDTPKGVRAHAHRGST